MTIIISPAKTQDFSAHNATNIFSEPAFLKESLKLVKELKKQSPQQIASLMSVSNNIAERNYSRFKSIKTPFTPDNAKQALSAFTGSVYTPCAAQNYTQQHC